MRIEYYLRSVLLVILILNSCVSQRKLTYLQYPEPHSDSILSVSDTSISATPTTYKILPYDVLLIRVITPDPQWSTIFNSMPVGAGGLITEESASLFGYQVDIDGKIEIPYVGKINAGGKTLSVLRTELDSIFKNYVTDGSITLRLVNNYVSVIGEVRHPGRFPLTKDRITIFDALAMAGDMSEFSDRKKVQMIRQSTKGPVTKVITLADRSILSSDFYYVMPNDIIYSLPLNGKSFQVNSSFWSLFLSTITSALGVIAFFRTF